MRRLALSLALLLAAVLPAAAQTSYSSCLALSLMTPGDPAVTNTWGTTTNTNWNMVDQAAGGTLTLSVAGNSTVILTTTNGAVDQSRYGHFIFTGVLTGNINVLWPNGKCRIFSVFNNTTGAFTLTAAANNGSGSPAGTTYTIPQGATAVLVSDGTNVTQRLVRLAPSVTVLTSGSAQTYTTPIGATALEIKMVGSGGGGASGTNAGLTGTDTTFGSLTAHAGVGATNNGGAGGTATGCDVNLQGGTGGSADLLANVDGGAGGISAFGGAGAAGTIGRAAGPAQANTGSGGGGGGNNAGTASGGGGGAGGYCEKTITAPAATYTYTVGAHGTGGAASGGNNAGANGADGLIEIRAVFW